MNTQQQDQGQAGAEVSPLRLRAARAAGRAAAGGGLPISVFPFEPGPDGGVTPLMEAFVYGYNSKAEG